MATLNSLKQALRQKAEATNPSSKQSLSVTQYSAGFDILMQGPGWTTYKDFIIPQLSELLATLCTSRSHISVLEIGPGPKSVLGYLPTRLRRKIGKYTAFEPNGLFAAKLEEWLYSASLDTESPLPSVKNAPDIFQNPFVLQDVREHDKKYDIILFCHSMYGMNSKQKYIEKALGMLVEESQGGIVVVFHRDGALNLGSLVCHRTASFPTGVVRVLDNNEALDCFAPFVAGFVPQDAITRDNWRKVCRALGRNDGAHPGRILFSAPDIMMAFNKHATSLPDLLTQVPSANGGKVVKNWEARIHSPACIVRPTAISHVQKCVRWALKQEVGLTILGGGHSGHCLRPNVVAVDMGAFDQIDIIATRDDDIDSGPNSDSGPLVFVEAGCKTGDIIRKTTTMGVTVPLGARPSVGAGLWLQGGIGHLARSHGLACDAVVGAVVVSVVTGDILCLGRVPSSHWPVGGVRPSNEAELFWAICGAGTNFGIVISVTFKACRAPTFSTRNWIVPLSDNLEARQRLRDFDDLVARKLPRNYSADAYLYWDVGKLHLGVTMFESITPTTASTPSPIDVGAILGLEDDSKPLEESSATVDGVGLFEAEMYVSRMHGGHGGGKTSSFKRCLFLKRIGEVNVVDSLVAAIATRPSPLCYLHLLQGGGAIGDIGPDATAFGCRDWDFACVITSVWPRHQDGTEASRSAVQWVYNVVGDLLSLRNCTGVYGADLGPDPRDVVLAAKAFGQNGTEIARFKGISDPHRVLAYACPLPKTPTQQKLIILVTGESCAGKDYCADAWVSIFPRCARKPLTARVSSISDATKREYAAASGADLGRLRFDRAYKEHHRPTLTVFFQEQVRQRPRLPEEHFLEVVHDATDVEVLLITGMRDEAPVAAFSHLVPDCRLVEVRVQASERERRTRRGLSGIENGADNSKDSDKDRPNIAALNYCPSLIFDNDTAGNRAAERFAERHLFPLVHEDLQRLANMVRSVPDFPRPNIEFRHVLGIAQQPDGLALCTSLLETHFIGDWGKVDAIACCEVGGLVYAPALASSVDVPLVLIREAGKLPPPTVSVTKTSSYISSVESKNAKEKKMEMEQGVVRRGASVVVVDDVLSTGETLCAVLQLLNEAGVIAENVSIMVIAEFPAHRGRQLLRQRGYGRVPIQSLLVFDGV
ncbi:hypothetical protein BDV95DRAFT_494922 [Massariosphaeria phaeospora]|uniref:FAD-binding PCMH-type domain-containing protein n=1 Tax=Massariosphaeria phaeospora TaxID=100035 RepID=A0A7C8M7G9_9PLEO|nr:hypothetical protein BDV95DRAFT_494922 [Massariosphaeria phaeospora]